MNDSRRKFLSKGGQVTAAGMLGLFAGGCTGSAKEKDPEKKEKPASKEPEKQVAMVGACGLSCMACPLMKAGKCKGCASGTEASAEMVDKKPCPVLKCAAMKKIDYCGTGCKKFAECDKLIGHPYAQAFMDMMKKRMGASA